MSFFTISVLPLWAVLLNCPRNRILVCGDTPQPTDKKQSGDFCIKTLDTLKYMINNHYDFFLFTKSVLVFITKWSHCAHLAS